MKTAMRDLLNLRELMIDLRIQGRVRVPTPCYYISSPAHRLDSRNGRREGNETLNFSDYVYSSWQKVSIKQRTSLLTENKKQEVTFLPHQIPRLRFMPAV